MFYDKKFIWKCLLGFVAMMLAMRLTNGAGFVVIFGLFIAGAAKRDAILLLYGLAMTISMLIGNSNLMPKGSIFAIAQRSSMLLLSFLLIAQVFGQRQDKSLSCFLFMLLYTVYMFATSFSGWCPMISAMKIILYTSVFLAYFGVANTVANSRKDLSVKARSVFLSTAIFFLVGSVLLIPFPGLAQLRAEEYMMAVKSGAHITSLFTGMTFHSQTLGPVAASLGVALLADLLFGIRKPDKLYIALLISVPIILWKTSSRTAMGTFIIGALFCVYMFMSARGIKNRWKAKVTSVSLFLMIGLSFLVLILPSIREKALGFALKYNNDNIVAEQMNVDDVLLTRQGKWDEGIYNWRQSPWIGNGFQVSEDMVGMQVGLSTLSAPVEKSIWISAILEEGGIFGFVIFMIFLIVTFVTLKINKAYIGLSCFIALMLTNFGEFTLFSMSAGGGFLWALVFIGVALDIRRRKDENIRNRIAPRMYGYTPTGYNPTWR